MDIGEALPRNGTESLIESGFLATTSETVLNQIISTFIDATSNEALKIVICGSCARETCTEDSKEILLEDIPNKHQLIPHIPHAAHRLVDGLLIHASALVSSKETMNLCNGCRNQLKKNLRPPLSLSNGMWVGDIPRELQNLTLPERLLVAKYYPSAYIVKLYPKQKNASTWDQTQMHSGLKGNVSTYRLDSRQISHMIDGTILPPPAKILSATIGITFVGPKGVRESAMPAMFRVRRWRVRDGLLWLKVNNPLYEDIVISEERLLELPEDGIPDELTMMAKHNPSFGERKRRVRANRRCRGNGTRRLVCFEYTKKEKKLTPFASEPHYAMFYEAGLIEVDEKKEEEFGNTQTKM